MKNFSELRQDIVTGDWVVVATGRGKRPHAYRGHPEPPQPKSGCPFERLLPEALLVFDRAGNRYYPSRKNRRQLERSWWLQIVPNKYPAFQASKTCPVPNSIGPYERLPGIGFHEVVVTRDHTRSLAAMTPEEAAILIRGYRERYSALKSEQCAKYVSIFHNHGHDAGATISHPHSQIIAIPVIPPDVGRSLAGSAAYYRKHRRCVHCAMIAFERSDGRRVIYENTGFIAFCPYVSRQAFEIRIFPKRHQAEFGAMREGEIALAGEALRTALAKLERGLRRPAYNFFLHTAPTAGGQSGAHYHWHIEILPKTAVWAGFEIGTGIQISSISPEAAGRYLRRIRV